ncbi:hypothetical protein F5884DRAFT_319900 [Xylogone sp. PMI_703]|nr:hypothetical protein F5884DRAFT_319900 [Xylogone sp. PMI_703]
MAVRIASALDLTATARIAYRGFSLSPWNAFYRPHAAQYPDDVENSYRHEQELALVDGKKLFIVIEVPDTPGLPSEPSLQQPIGPAQEKVVGFTIWNYPPGSSRTKESKTFSVPDPIDRSIDPVRSALLFNATEAAVNKYLKHHMELDNMAVDPTFFRHGYGTKLCQYGMNIAKEDSVPIGVIAAAMGAKLYEHLGFETIIKEIVTDERAGMEDTVDFWVQTWQSQ